VILTNELPRLSDSSGALASRFVALVLTRSFYGQENPLLTDELLTEAPGIFNWALDGLDRLTARCYFVQPASARESIDALADLASPVTAFVHDRCHIGPAATVFVDDLFAAWKLWCDEQGNARIGTKASFGVELRSAVPKLGKRRLREDDRRASYIGIGLGDPPLFDGVSP
jgi:putative DNA primase/helicase